MTQQEQDDIALLGKFVGLVIKPLTWKRFPDSTHMCIATKEDDGEYYINWPEEDLHFYTPERDWSQLMKIVEKINSSTGKIVKIEGYTCEITSASNENPSHKSFRIFYHSKTEKEAIYKACLEFVKQYKDPNED